MKFVLESGQMIPIIGGVIEHAKEEAIDHMRDAIMTFILATFDVARDLSFTVALIGGGICIIVYAVTGIKKAGRIAGLLVLGHALLRYLMGGV